MLFFGKTHKENKLCLKFLTFIYQNHEDINCNLHVHMNTIINYCIIIKECHEITCNIYNTIFEQKSYICIHVNEIK